MKLKIVFIAAVMALSVISSSATGAVVQTDPAKDIGSQVLSIAKKSVREIKSTAKNLFRIKSIDDIDWTATAPIIVSVLALGISTTYRRSSRRSANAAEKSSTSAERSSWAAEDSAKAAKDTNHYSRLDALIALKKSYEETIERLNKALEGRNDDKQLADKEKYSQYSDVLSKEIEKYYADVLKDNTTQNSK